MDLLRNVATERRTAVMWSRMKKKSSTGSTISIRCETEPLSPLAKRRVTHNSIRSELP